MRPRLFRNSAWPGGVADILQLILARPLPLSGTSIMGRFTSQVIGVAPVAIESLECRRLLAAVQLTFILNDPTGLFAAQQLLVSNLQAVAQIFAQNFEGKGTIDVEVIPNRDYLGGPAMAPSGVQFVSSDGSFTTVEYNPVHEARTGIDPNGGEADIGMMLDPGYYFVNVAFLDPSGADG